MKTAVGPVPTSMPGDFNYTTPPMATRPSVPTPSPYLPDPHGGAARLDILSGKVGFLEAGFAVVMAAFIIG
jgi:hypothetical protein